MSTQAIAMIGTTLDTAGIGGEKGSLVAALGPSLLGTLGFSGLVLWWVFGSVLTGP